MASAIACFLYLPAEHVRRTRIYIALGTVSVLLVAALSHVNISEIMFNPTGRPSFVRGAQAKLDAGEKVLAININGAARAYPKTQPVSIKWPKVNSHRRLSC